MSRLSKHTYFLFFCALLIFCFYQPAAAQSGRRVEKKVATPQPTPPVESKSAKTEKETVKETEKEAQTDETPVKISSLIVIGEVQHNFTYYKSNEIDAALKECIRMLQSSKTLSQITKGGGKITYKQAKEQAEEEAETYVLWLGFAAKDDGYGNMYIDFIQYALLTPKTAKVVTRGQIEADPNQVLATGGVLNIPKVSRRTYSLIQMKDGARQIAAILLRGGWLK
jgi:hypothetical protein